MQSHDNENEKECSSQASISSIDTPPYGEMPDFAEGFDFKITSSRGPPGTGTGRPRKGESIDKTGKDSDGDAMMICDDEGDNELGKRRSPSLQVEEKAAAGDHPQKRKYEDQQYHLEKISKATEEKPAAATESSLSQIRGVKEKIHIDFKRTRQEKADFEESKARTKKQKIELDDRYK